MEPTGLPEREKLKQFSSVNARFRLGGKYAAIPHGKLANINKIAGIRSSGNPGQISRRWTISLSILFFCLAPEMARII